MKLCSSLLVLYEVKGLSKGDRENITWRFYVSAEKFLLGSDVYVCIKIKTKS